MHGHNIHSLATVNYQLPRGETLFHLPLTNILEIFKDFFACKFVLAANQQQPENIRRLFRLQICLSRKSSTTRKYSKTFWATNISDLQQQPASAIYSSNQHQRSTAATSISDLQQQPASAIYSSNQHQRSTAATSISDLQQQPASAINSSNQQQQPTAANSSNNHLQQLTAAMNSSNQEQQSTAAILPASLPQSTTTHVR